MQDAGITRTVVTPVDRLGKRVERWSGEPEAVVRALAKLLEEEDGEDARRALRSTVIRSLSLEIEPGLRALHVVTATNLNTGD